MATLQVMHLAMQHSPAGAPSSSSMKTPASRIYNWHIMMRALLH